MGEQVVGLRGRMGVIAPSTNTVVEHDFAMIRPHGVTFHTGRMYIENPALDSDDAFERLLGEIRQSITIAIRDVITCEPTHMLMGMSAETFWGGVEGNKAFIERVREQSGGLDVSTGASACRDALAAFGAERIAVFSPYQPVADRQVSSFFTEAGFDVAAVTGLRCSSATTIAEVTPADLEPVVDSLDGPEVDAIVQVGTNLSFVRQAAELEHQLGKPVLAINVATLWHALRATGVDDRISGFGRILAEH
ncbi:MAG: maleate cis-trans isomerase family protein [Acidimicrobiales bacterium]